MKPTVQTTASKWYGIVETAQGLLSPQDSLVLIVKPKFSMRFSQKHGPAEVDRNVLI